MFKRSGGGGSGFAEMKIVRRLSRPRLHEGTLSAVLVATVFVTYNSWKYDDMKMMMALSDGDMKMVMALSDAYPSYCRI